VECIVKSSPQSWSIACSCCLSFALSLFLFSRRAATVAPGATFGGGINEGRARGFTRPATMLVWSVLVVGVIAVVVPTELPPCNQSSDCARPAESDTLFCVAVATGTVTTKDFSGSDWDSDCKCECSVDGVGDARVDCCQSWSLWTAVAAGVCVPHTSVVDSKPWWSQAVVAVGVVIVVVANDGCDSKAVEKSSAQASEPKSAPDPTAAVAVAV
jgi:hypothetical protein